MEAAVKVCVGRAAVQDRFLGCCVGSCLQDNDIPSLAKAGIADRWGSRILVMCGFGIYSGVMFTFSQLTDQSPSWILIVLYIVFGMGAGLMLASLHRAALNDVPDDVVGISSGIYSMIRFLGSTCGAAVGGILLQYFLDQANGTVAAYQNVFLWFAGFAITGLLIATRLPDKK